MSGGAHGTPASGRANRRRGADAERQVVNYLREHGYPDARRYLAGDSRQPGDIDAIPGVSIEVKDRARSAWPLCDPCHDHIHANPEESYAEGWLIHVEAEYAA